MGAIIEGINVMKEASVFIGKNIRIYRQQIGLTVDELCRLLCAEYGYDLKSENLTLYESGSGVLSFEVLQMISGILGVELVELCQEFYYYLLSDGTNRAMLEAYCVIQNQMVRRELLELIRSL